MRDRLALWGAVVRQAVTLPDRAAHALVVRDVDSWLRLQFLGVASRLGIARALVHPSTTEEIAARTDARDVDLLEAFLQLGVGLGEVAHSGGRYRAKGRRLRAVAGRSEDLRGLVEELVAYDSPIYAHLGEHLGGAPPRPYLRGVGDAIARSSRLAEPVLAPVIRSVAAQRRPRSVLDVGCGSGIYLQHVLDVAPHATAVGIDLDEGALATARAALRRSGQSVGLHHVRLEDFVADQDDPFDLVLLLQNIYYWPPDERPAVFSRLRRLASRGTVVVASAVPSGPAVNRHLDVVLRVTVGNWRLPTAAELNRDLHTAGFEHVDVIEPVPRTGFVAAVAS